MEFNGLVEAAIVSYRCNGRKEVTLNGWPFVIEREQDGVHVFDHLGLEICAIDPDGVFVAPHYSAAELMPLFA